MDEDEYKAGAEIFKRTITDALEKIKEEVSILEALAADNKSVLLDHENNIAKLINKAGDNLKASIIYWNAEKQKAYEYQLKKQGTGIHL